MRFKIILVENKEFHIALNIGENVNRFCYHGAVLSWSGCIMGRFHHGEILLSWGGFVIVEKFCYHQQVLISRGGFVIIGRFYHGEILLSW